MPDEVDALGHLLILGRVEDRDFNREGRGKQEFRSVDRQSHGRNILNQAEDALKRQTLPSNLSLPELEALGTIITIEGASEFRLKLQSLEQRSTHKAGPRPKWILLTVHPATGDSLERALVWVSDEYCANFLRVFERYVYEEHAQTGKPKNEALVANIAQIRSAMLRDLWQSDGEPSKAGRRWWEIWLQPEPEAVTRLWRYADALNLRRIERSLRFDNRHIAWIEARWADLEALPFSSVPVTEIRAPSFVDTVEDLDQTEQFEYVDDLAERITHASSTAPAVCLLDTGVRRTHVLLEPALDPASHFSVSSGTAGDSDGHGTQMAGLALLGPLDDLLLGNGGVNMLHRLESVKVIPEADSRVHTPDAYGLVIAQAVAVPEAANGSRDRVYSMAITSSPDRPGEPSLWSAAVDALAAGSDIGSTPGAIELLGLPDDEAKRLLLVSAGNVDHPYASDYLSKSELSPIDDPAQAWNALTVGAYTELVDTPSDPNFAGWAPLAQAGDISPHTRTGVVAGGRQWPIKPDICMEGGNVLTDHGGDFHANHPVTSLRTTSRSDDRALTSANATSAAVSQAARLAARTMATYPDYWPETIRGLLTHSAEWTSVMRSAVLNAGNKTARRNLLRRFGWGVPNDESTRTSALHAVTMVVQDSFLPFTGPKHRMRHFRLHQLPWPAEQLRDLGEADVELRLTLSYFIEPSASRRGWRGRYAYASHGLRFELRTPNETTEEFVRRVNHEAASEEDGATSSRSSGNWLLGPNQRNGGSLHQDVWQGHGAQLATMGSIGVHAVGGWWKNNKRKDRVDLPVRYALLVSLRTHTTDVDLYTPIAASIQVPVTAVAVET